MPNATSGFVFEGYSKNYDWIYNYIDMVLHERLWLADTNQPYMPVGTMRMAQYRAENDCKSGDAIYSKSCTTDLECFRNRTSPKCNQVYKIDESEAKEYYQ